MSKPEGWDWNRKVPMWDWHSISLNLFRSNHDKKPLEDGDLGYGWETIDGETPPNVQIAVKQGVGMRTSRDLAVETDDWCKGEFYYRDFTDSGIPVVRDDEVYHAAFWFQFASDKEEFEKRYITNAEE
jgi:hypothetical protein